MTEYYAQRASAGLIVTEATGISREGLGWAYAPGLWTAEQREGAARDRGGAQGGGAHRRPALAHGPHRAPQLSRRRAASLRLSHHGAGRGPHL